MNLNTKVKSFKHTLLAVAFGAIGMGSLAISASETEERHVMIKIDKTDGHDALIDLKVDGFAEAFSLPDLEDGGSEAIVTESGKTIVVSKMDGKLSIEVDGKNIDLPELNSNLSAHIRRSMPLHHKMDNSIQINGADLDENQMQIIKDAFLAAGVDKKIRFSKGNMMVFSTGDDINFGDNKVIIKKSGGDFEWVSDDQEVFELKVGNDAETKVHTRVLHVETSED